MTERFHIPGGPALHRSILGRLVSRLSDGDQRLAAERYFVLLPFCWAIWFIGTAVLWGAATQWSAPGTADVFSLSASGNTILLSQIFWTGATAILTLLGWRNAACVVLDAEQVTIRRGRLPVSIPYSSILEAGLVEKHAAWRRFSAQDPERWIAGNGGHDPVRISTDRESWILGISSADVHVFLSRLEAHVPTSKVADRNVA